MKTSLKFGIIAGALLVLLDYLFYNYLFESSVGSFTTFFQMLIVGGAILLGIKEVKRKKYQGEITYKNASLTGFLITIYAAVLYGATVYAVYPYGNEAFSQEYIVLTKERLLEQGEGPEAVSEQVELAKSMLSAETMAKAAFYSTGIIGVIFSLIFASFLRKKRPFDSNKGQESNEIIDL